MRRLTILLAAVGALMLLPAAQAFANGTMTVIPLGAGSGEVDSTTGVGGEGLFGIGEPPIECAYNGETEEATGVCETELEASEGVELLSVHRTAAQGSEFIEWFIEGETFPVDPCGINEYCGGAALEGEEPKITVFVIFEPCAEGSEAPSCVEEEEPENPNVKLTIEEGSGTVISNPAGLECSGEAVTACEAELAEGSVTLTASPAPGYLFKNWKKCDTGGVNGRQCTITATSELKEIGANFIKVWDLTISKAEGSGPGIAKTKPGGIVCLYACLSGTASYKEGKAVEVPVKPAKHFHFVEYLNGTGQTEACNGHNEEEGCSYEPAGEDSSIEVLFEEDEKNTLSLAKEGGGQGIVKSKPAGLLCLYTCSAAEAEFYFNETATIKVKLNKGTSSVEWTTGAGTCTGKVETLESECTVPMGEAHELVAKFE